MTRAERKEKMNELMNKISFALKDATLQQGFEIICKRIAELEKENEKLNLQLSDIVECYISTSIHDDIEMADVGREIREILFEE